MGPCRDRPLEQGLPSGCLRDSRGPMHQGATTGTDWVRPDHATLAITWEPSYCCNTCLVDLWDCLFRLGKGRGRLGSSTVPQHGAGVGGQLLSGDVERIAGWRPHGKMYNIILIMITESACAQVGDVSLPELYRLGEEAVRRLEEGGSGMDASQQLQTLASAMASLAAASKRVEALALFSRNEEVDDITTADLKYLMLPFLEARALACMPTGEGACLFYEHGDWTGSPTRHGRRGTMSGGAIEISAVGKKDMLGR